MVGLNVSSAVVNRMFCPINTQRCYAKPCSLQSISNLQKHLTQIGPSNRRRCRLISRPMTVNNKWSHHVDTVQRMIEEKHMVVRQPHGQLHEDKQTLRTSRSI